jgi:membrane-associated HD superfamily phosphohydrolase
VIIDKKWMVGWGSVKVTERGDRTMEVLISNSDLILMLVLVVGSALLVAWIVEHDMILKITWCSMCIAGNMLITKLLGANMTIIVTTTMIFLAMIIILHMISQKDGPFNSW